MDTDVNWTATAAAFGVDDDADALAEYTAAQRLDVRELVLHDGADPTVFVVRALTPREVRVSGCRVAGFDESDSHKERLTKLTEMYMGLVRFGLVDVEGWDGWTAERESHEVVASLRVWPESVVSRIPPGTLMFLGMAIYSLSSLDDAKKKPSGSSRGARGGTASRKGRKANGTARARSRAKRSARGTK